MTTPFLIPATPEDVTPDLCRRVFVDVLGGRLINSGKGELNGSIFVFRLGNIWSAMDNYFNPFTRIQDTLLCMPWVDENNFYMTMDFTPNAVSCELIRHDFSVKHLDYPEPFTRMIAILKAANKIMEEK